MKYVRVNKLVREGVSIEVLSDLFGQNINPNDKLVINKDHNDMSTEELIEMKNYIHRILNNRLDILHNKYSSLKDKIDHPELYVLSDQEYIEQDLPF
jgi:hypothetical protein